MPPAVRTTRQSLDDNDAASTTTSLTRTASNRSDSSGYGSTASFSSTASTTSGRRMIIPLYNLQAHNVMTNTIVDAGTDAKIARFQKRGIELIDVAALEPVEVWGESRRGRTSRAATPDFTSEGYSSVVSLPYHPPSLSPSSQPAAIAPKRNHILGKLFKKSDKDPTPPALPLASGFSTSSGTQRQSTMDSMNSSSAIPTSARSGSARGHTRNHSSSLSPSAIADKIRNRSSSPNPPLNLNPPEDNASIHSSSVDHTNPGPSPDEKTLRPPILGIQPALSYAYTHSSGAAAPGPVSASSLSKNARALMYVWFVRKWLKRKDRDRSSFIGNMIDEEVTGLFGKIRGSSKTQGSPLVSAAVSEDVEVRFEWRRIGGKARVRGGRLGAKRSRTSLVPGVDVEGEERTRERDVEHSQSNRLSVISQHSISTNLSVSEDGSPRRERPGTSQAQGRTTSGDGRDRERDVDGEDPGEDSEPEDSETPWVCTLKIRKSGTGPTSAAGSLRTRTREGDGELLPAGNGSPVTSQMIDGQEEVGVLPSPSQPQVLRVKVGTLSPTPHHPKVVAMLKVPFPLPDVEVERMGVRKRSVGEYCPCIRDRCFDFCVPLLQVNGPISLNAMELPSVLRKSRMRCVVLRCG